MQQGKVGSRRRHYAHGQHKALRANTPHTHSHTHNADRVSQLTNYLCMCASLKSLGNMCVSGAWNWNRCHLKHAVNGSTNNSLSNNNHNNNKSEMKAISSTLLSGKLRTIPSNFRYEKLKNCSAPSLFLSPLSLSISLHLCCSSFVAGS